MKDEQNIQDFLENKIKKLEEIIQENHETRIQQESAHHSDMKKQISDMDKKFSEKIENIEDTLKSWKLGGKLMFWGLATLGAFVTWLLGTFGLHLTTSR